MHQYSLRNTCLVLAQAERRGDNKFIGILNGFQNWKKQNIQILKNSKSYQILIPMFRKVLEEMESEPEEEEKQKTINFFKVGNVFDMWQTTEYECYLEEERQIDEKIMQNTEIDYNTAFNFVATNFPKIKIEENFTPLRKKGVYEPLSHNIILYEKSSNTLFHEIGHNISISLLGIAGHISKNYAKNEVLAELTSYLLLKRFDEAISYNFAYSNVWANKITELFELDEFIKCYQAISKHIEEKLIF